MTAADKTINSEVIETYIYLTAETEPHAITHDELKHEEFGDFIYGR